MVIRMLDKEKLISKIASSAGIESPVKTLEKESALKAASIALKMAAQSQREWEHEKKAMLTTIEKLSSEIENIKEDRSLAEKTVMAKETAELMFEKGMIKKSEIQSKIEELAQLDIKGIEVMNNTVSNMPEKTASEYVSDLTFLCEDNNIREKETLSGSLTSYFK